MVKNIEGEAQINVSNRKGGFAGDFSFVGAKEHLCWETVKNT